MIWARLLRRCAALVTFALMLLVACGGLVEESDQQAPADAAPPDSCQLVSPDVACQKSECRSRMISECPSQAVLTQCDCSVQPPYRSCTTNSDCTVGEACTKLSFHSCFRCNSGTFDAICWAKP